MAWGASKAREERPPSFWLTNPPQLLRGSDMSSTGYQGGEGRYHRGGLSPLSLNLPPRGGTATTGGRGGDSPPLITTTSTTASGGTANATPASVASLNLRRREADVGAWGRKSQGTLSLLVANPSPSPPLLVVQWGPNGEGHSHGAKPEAWRGAKAAD